MGSEVVVVKLIDGMKLLHQLWLLLLPHLWILLASAAFLLIVLAGYLHSKRKRMRAVAEFREAIRYFDRCNR